MTRITGGVRNGIADYNRSIPNPPATSSCEEIVISTSLATRTAGSPQLLLRDHFRTVRRWTEQICEPLTPEDCVIQSMPDASPTRWHLAHTTWFFETFVLKPTCRDYQPFDPAFEYLFNSYYNQVGKQFPRPERGLLSRPGLSEVMHYRSVVDEAIESLLERDEQLEDNLLQALELGLHHEQQHQELILTDIKHLFSCNPCLPAYRPREDTKPTPTTAIHWIAGVEGVRWIGHQGRGFAYDNEFPRHEVLVQPHELASRLVTCGEYIEFIESGGYTRPEWWLSLGWHMANEHHWQAPLYWRKVDGQWHQFTLAGLRLVNPSEPVCHVSFFEADAFSRWSNCRLPTEAEWELAAAHDELLQGANLAQTGRYHPAPAASIDDGRTQQLFGDVWEWTASPYLAYPGYKPPAGAIGEYNGKFMCNQYVLRGAPAPRRTLTFARRTAISSHRPRGGNLPASDWPNSYPPSAMLPILSTTDMQAEITNKPALHNEQFRRDVLHGLRADPKHLPSKYFYDQRGSQLFDRICELPEYYPTRTEVAIMRRYAQAMAERIGGHAMVLELGSGSSMKTNTLLEHLTRPACYVPVDISGDHLRLAAHRIAREFPDIEVCPLHADFSQPFQLPEVDTEIQRRIVYFPGSTIGNFPPSGARELLARLAAMVGPNGALLIGFDLVKSREILERAYDDSQLVTAAFNKNLLRRINRELQANFQVSQFDHHAVYNSQHNRIEMHLVSNTNQTVSIGDKKFTFAPGESIRTELSHKYHVGAFNDLAAEAGFNTPQVWTDPQSMFAVAYYPATA